MIWQESKFVVGGSFSMKNCIKRPNVATLGRLRTSGLRGIYLHNFMVVYNIIWLHNRIFKKSFVTGIVYRQKNMHTLDV